MTDDEWEKKMEFLLNQQADFSARMGQLEDIVARFAQATADRFQLTDRRISEQDERISAVISSQLELQESQRELQESHKKTEESLRNLIAVVDRYFEGRNGQSQA